MVNEIVMASAVPQTNGGSVGTPDFPPLERSCEVCIIGAGIPGMICALLLKKQGIDVHIYERQAAIYPLPRAVILADESLSVAAKAGLGYELKNIMKSGTAGGKDFVWVDAKDRMLERLDGYSRGCSGYPRVTVFCQPVFESAVALACEAAGIPIYRHWEFDGFQKPSSEVDIADSEYEIFFKSYKGTNRYNPTMNVRAKWLIGADGANSSVRKSAGIEQIDFGLCYDWLIVDCIPAVDHSKWAWKQVCDPERPTTMIASGNRRFRWEFMRLPHETIQELTDPKSVWKWMAKYGMNSTNCEIERSVVYRFRSLQAEKYWDGSRICLIGDAAHQMPPFIGQGLNSGIRDSAALAWRLGAILRGGADEHIISSYNLERKAHVDEVMKRSIALGEPICQTDLERSTVMHALLRDSFVARGCLPEPFCLELAHADGGFYDSTSYGGCLERRAGKFQPKLDGDEELKETFGWHVVALGKEESWQTSQLTKQLLDKLKATVFLLGEDDDGTDAYAKWFGENGNARRVLIRPDNYVYGFAKSDDTLEALLTHATKGLGIACVK